MYEKFAIDSKFDLKPLMDLVETNVSVTEKLLQQQASYVVEVLNASVDHVKSLGDISEVSAAIEAQQSFAQSMGQRFVDVAKLQFETLTEAKDAASKLFDLEAVAPVKAAPAKKAPAKKAAAAEAA
jgi:hypothetical protein